MNGKGDKRRPYLVSREELDLRWEYAKGGLKLTEKQMKQKIEEIRKITRRP
jgi:hypothetical protein